MLSWPRAWGATASQALQHLSFPSFNFIREVYVARWRMSREPEDLPSFLQRTLKPPELPAQCLEDIGNQGTAKLQRGILGCTLTLLPELPFGGC